jgi:MFS transporter, NNP family, nitrate/nitrite transporter
MRLANFRRAGHWPTLLCAFIYWTLSSVVWVLLGALGNALAADFHLSPGQKGLMVAVPVLGGALLRVPMGVLVERIGARRAALVGVALTVPSLLLGWLWVGGYAQLLAVGLLLGFAGAAFAAAFPLASRWYPPQYQGLALGIVGAGNTGTALGILFGSHLAAAVGWPMVFAMALAPMAVTFILLWRVARDAPGQAPARPLRDYAGPLKNPDTWVLCGFYSVAFGGFVGLASFLTIFFHDQYGLAPIRAGNVATLCAIAAGLLRPVGGYLADRHGGLRLLHVLLLALAILMAGMVLLPPLAWGTALLFVGMGMLGMANAAVMQLVPLRFPKEVGILSGLVGAAGGLGGFVFPSVLGALKGVSGSFAPGFLVFALAVWACAVVITALDPSWHARTLSPALVLAEPHKRRQPGHRTERVKDVQPDSTRRSAS